MKRVYKYITFLFVLSFLMIACISLFRVQAAFTVTLTEGVSIRTSGDNGLMFEASVSSAVNNAEYGMATSTLTINNYQFETTEVKPLEPKYGGVMKVCVTADGVGDAYSFTNATADKTYDEIQNYIKDGAYAYAFVTVATSIFFLPIAGYTVNSSNEVDGVRFLSVTTVFAVVPRRTNFFFASS